MQRNVALLIYLVIGLIDLILGAIYFTSDKFLFYHSQAVGTSWEETASGTQTLILALMKLAGGGWLALGLFTIALALREFKQCSLLARWVLPAGTLIFYIASLASTWSVYRNTGAASPWAPSLAIIAFALIALVIDAPWSTQKRRTN